MGQLAAINARAIDNMTTTSPEPVSIRWAQRRDRLVLSLCGHGVPSDMGTTLLSAHEDSRDDLVIILRRKAPLANEGPLTVALPLYGRAVPDSLSVVGMGYARVTFTLTKADASRGTWPSLLRRGAHTTPRAAIATDWERWDDDDSEQGDDGGHDDAMFSNYMNMMNVNCDKQDEEDYDDCVDDGGDGGDGDSDTSSTE